MTKSVLKTFASLIPPFNNLSSEEFGQEALKVSSGFKSGDENSFGGFIYTFFTSAEAFILSPVSLLGQLYGSGWMDSRETGWADDKSQGDDGIPIWPLAERRALNRRRINAFDIHAVICFAQVTYAHIYSLHRNCERVDHPFHTNGIGKWLNRSLETETRMAGSSTPGIHLF